MNMSCKECRRWISIKVDGERVPFPIAGRLDEHLEACSPCRGLLSSESRRAAVLRSALRPPDPARLAASIWKGLEEEDRGVVALPFPFPRSRLPLRVAALLLVAAGGWLALRWAGGGGGPADPDDGSGVRFTLELEEVARDVLSGSDGSAVGRDTYRVRRVSERDPASAAGGGPSAGQEVERLRLDRARTEYIRLVDYPYW